MSHRDEFKKQQILKLIGDIFQVIFSEKEGSTDGIKWKSAQKWTDISAEQILKFHFQIKEGSIVFVLQNEVENKKW